jgi:hypothetical protein
MSSFLIVGSTEIDPRLASSRKRGKKHRHDRRSVEFALPGVNQAQTNDKAGVILSRPWLPRLPRHRLPWTHRHLRTARDENDISELILTRAADARFYEAARANGMVSLREECLTLVARGETTSASQDT